MNEQQIEEAIAAYAEKLKDIRLESDTFEEYTRRINKLRKMLSA